MNTLFIGRNFIHLEETDSTNERARELFRDSPAEGSVILADFQTHGKGQRGKSWHSSKAENLTFSLVLYPDFLDSSLAFDLNKICCLAVIRLLKRVLSENGPRIKWPNDILFNNKKICGILIETSLDGNKVLNAVCGFGLNVNEMEFPEGFSLKPTSMRKESGEVFDRIFLMENLFEEIEAEYLALKSGKKKRLDSDYLKELYGYQENLLMRIDGKEEKVFFAGVDAQGRLALKVNGEMNYFQPRNIEFIF